MPTQSELEASILALDTATAHAEEMEEERRNSTEAMEGQGATEAEADAAGLLDPVAELIVDLEHAAEVARLQLNVITQAPNFGSDPAIYQPVEPVFIPERQAITGQFMAEPAPGAVAFAPTDDHPAGGFLLAPLESQVQNLREGVRRYGPIMSRHLDADGGAETGEWMYVEVNARGGGCIDRIILTEPGGITVRNVLVTSDGYGRGLQTAMFFQSVYRVMTVATITRGNPTIITFTAAHGLTPGKTMSLCVKVVGAPAAPDIQGHHIATVIDATTVTIPIDSGAPVGGSYPATNTYAGLIRLHNPTQAGGAYSSSSPYAYEQAPEADFWHVPKEFAHASICKSITYTPLKTLEDRVCSAVIEIVTVPCDFDADGMGALGDRDTDYTDHGGSQLVPAMWTGIEVVSRLVINPIVDGAANGFPGAMRYEIEWRFPLGLEGLALYTDTYWRAHSDGGMDCPNAHFCAHVWGERGFQQKWLWRGGNNTSILLTGRPFTTDAGVKGEWDSDGPYGVYIGGEAIGATKGENIGDPGGYQFYSPSAAELAAVCPDSATKGIIGIVCERTTTHKFAYASTVKTYWTEFPPGRSSTITYSRDAGSGVVGPEGDYVEGVASGANQKDYTRNYTSRYRSRLKPGKVMKNWHYLCFGLNAAELLTSWNGNAKGKLGMLLDAVGPTEF